VVGEPSLDADDERAMTLDLGVVQVLPHQIYEAAEFLDRLGAQQGQGTNPIV
jgi:hypothetical protein